MARIKTTTQANAIINEAGETTQSPTVKELLARFGPWGAGVGIASISDGSAGTDWHRKIRPFGSIERYVMFFGELVNHSSARIVG